LTCERLPAPATVTAVTAESPLLHNLDASIADQLLARVRTRASGPVDELHVTAPFFDADADALARLVSDYQPRLIRLYLAQSTSVNGAKLRQRLESSDATIEVSFYEPDQFVHAKLVGIVVGTRAWLLSGSANLSRAALLHAATGRGNIELAALAELTPDQNRRAFVPPDTTTVNRSLADLVMLSFESNDEPAAPPVVLVGAFAREDGRVEVTTDPAPTSNWVLSDLRTRYALVPGPRPETAVTDGPVAGRLVEIVNGADEVVSNRAVVDDPVALARAMKSTQSSLHADRPVELTAADLGSPLGAAITWLHRNLVMDVTERASATPTGGVSDTEATEQSDDELWERLEREQLARDPRAGLYSRIWRTHSLGSDDPMIELLEAFGSRAPAARRDAGASSSILAEVIRLAHTTPDAPDSVDDADDKSSRRWRPGTRIRVRARNALRRWAAAQNDPRLIWVNPLAPAGNFAMIATTLAHLRLDAALHPDRVVLTADDLDDLWTRWLRPFVGTGLGDGWLDRQRETSSDDLLDRVPRGLPEVVAALVWLAIRPGPDQRRRVIELQTSIVAARRHQILRPTGETARFLSAVTGDGLSRDEIDRDLRAAEGFIDDDLWCERLAAELDLPAIRIKPSPGAQHIQVRLDVDGIEDPRLDPRVPRVVIEVRHYRGCEGVAVFAGNGSWRLVMPGEQPALFLAGLGSKEVTTRTAITDDQLEALVSAAGVLADLFQVDEVA
jgi:hypothetical protein